MSEDKTIRHSVSPDKWVDEYGDYLYYFAYTRVNDKQIANDLIQDTFLAALSALSSFEGRSSEKTWLTSILKRKIIDHYRKNSRKKEHNILDQNSAEGRENLPFYDSGDMEGSWRADRTPKDWHLSSGDSLENEELREIIFKCISVLPEKWASVFSLRVVEELSTEDVCKELEITSSNLWVILHRAKLQLRDCVEKNWLK